MLSACLWVSIAVNILLLYLWCSARPAKSIVEKYAASNHMTMKEYIHFAEEELDKIQKKPSSLRQSPEAQYSSVKYIVVLACFALFIVWQAFLLPNFFNSSTAGSSPTAQSQAVDTAKLSESPSRQAYDVSPAQQPKQETIQQDSQQNNYYSIVVYVTNTGSKYHVAGCSYLRSKNSITLADAKTQGYSPCSRCNPPR